MDTSALLFLSSNAILIAVTCVLILVIVYLTEFGVNEKNGNAKRSMLWTNRVIDEDDVPARIGKPPPGPKPFPILGNLTCMSGYEVPYEAFTDLGKRYGPIVSLRLGSVPAVVVNGVDNIKEVLIAKSSHFDGRPNFQRYHILFGGDKQNCK